LPAAPFEGMIAGKEASVMIRRLGGRLFAVFSGALTGYVFGWIWGWSLFDPNSDVWALAAFAGAVIGLVIGLLPNFWRFAGVLIAAVLGLYLGWVARTLLFGDVPGGWGMALLMAGMAAGGAVGARPGFRQRGAGLGALIGVLYAGLFGGFLIAIVFLEILTGWLSEHTIVSQAPAVILCGIAGGVAGSKLGRSQAQAKHESEKGN